MSPHALVSSYLTVSPLPIARRFTFCCTFPWVTPGGCYPPLLPYGVRTFLDSLTCRDYPADSPYDSVIEMRKIGYSQLVPHFMCDMGEALVEYTRASFAPSCYSTSGELLSRGRDSASEYYEPECAGETWLTTFLVAQTNVCNRFSDKNVKEFAKNLN